MKIEIRHAYVSDAKIIAEIIKLAFDDDVDLLQMNTLLQLSHHHTFVAVQSERIVAFVDNFLTISQHNTTRLELDLLAVHPQFRGHGIAKQLIQASVQFAKQLNVGCIRTLIAADNIAMQKACTQLNLKPSKQQFSLYLQSPKPTDAKLVQEIGSHLIRVDTMTYTGLWLEADISNTTLTNASIIATQSQLDTIGAVVDKLDNAKLKLLTQREFTNVGNYQWWMLNLGND